MDSRLTLIVGDERAAVPAEIFEGIDSVEAVPLSVTILEGDRGGEPMRGLRLDVGGVEIDVLLPAGSARAVGKALAFDGIEIAKPGDVPA